MAPWSLISEIRVKMARKWISVYSKPALLVHFLKKLLSRRKHFHILQKPGVGIQIIENNIY